MTSQGEIPSGSQLGATSPEGPEVRGPLRSVLLVDAASRWARRPADLIGAIFVGLAMVALVLIAIYGASTALAVTIDVRNVAATIAQTILFLPITILEGFLSFFIPLAVIVEALMNARFRLVITTIVAGLVAAGSAYGYEMLLRTYFPLSQLTVQLTSYSIESDPHDISYFSLLPYVAVIAAVLTVAKSHRSFVSRYGPGLFTVVLILSVLQGNQTLPAATLTALHGIFCGLLFRWIIGDVPRNLAGKNLIDAIRRAGIDAAEVIRIDALSDGAQLAAWTVRTRSPLGIDESEPAFSRFRREAVARISPDTPPSTLDIAPELTEGIQHEPFLDAAALYHETAAASPIPSLSKAARHFRIRTVDGAIYRVDCFDPDQRIVGLVESWWMKFRLTITFRHTEKTLPDTANHVALMAMAAERGGVALPDHFHGVTTSRGTYLAIFKSDDDAAPLMSASLTDDDVDALWATLLTAHRAGLSHGNIHAGVIHHYRGGFRISEWEHGSISSSDLNRQIDLAQMTALLAGMIGVERTVNSVMRCLPENYVHTLGPLLQNVVVPAPTMTILKEQKLLSSLRDALLPTSSPTMTARPIQLQRFQAKTVVIVAIGAIAIYLLLGSLNFEDLKEALEHSNYWWLAVAFVASLLTYLGQGIMMISLTPERLRLWEATSVQVAASVITLVAPAGIGPAALNLRYLQKKKVTTARAVATVTAMQIIQFLTAVVLLVILSLATGEIGALTLPSPSVLIAIGIVVVLIGALLFIKPLRVRLGAILKPQWDQAWPRIVWLGSHPTVLAKGVGGAMITVVGFVATFGACLAAVGHTLPLFSLAITYLVSNSVGSIIPSPGGIGPVEAALTGGLVIAGIPYTVALSTAIIYRLVSFWGRVPLGWVALRILGRKDVI